MREAEIERGRCRCQASCWASLVSFKHALVKLCFWLSCHHLCWGTVCLSEFVILKVHVVELPLTGPFNVLMISISQSRLGSLRLRNLLTGP